MVPPVSRPSCTLHMSSICLKLIEKQFLLFPSVVLRFILFAHFQRFVYLLFLLLSLRLSLLSLCPSPLWCLSQMQCRTAGCNYPVS